MRVSVAALKGVNVREESPSRADFLLSWQFLVALGVLLVNDFVVKRGYPGAVSGFASDAAGMVFFPIAIVALAELVAWLMPRRPYSRTRWFIAATAFVSVGFVVVKMTTWGEAVYEALVTPVDAVLGTGIGMHGFGVVRDPLDLLALLLAPMSIWVGWQWRGRRTQPQAGEELDGLDVRATR